MEISFVFQDMLRDGQILDYGAIGEKLLHGAYSQAAYVHETIVDLAKEFEGLWNEEEGDYFTDIREFAKDRLSRIFSAGEADNSSGITKEDIANGITDGIVRFIVDPNMEEGTVCEIGENWFYFGGQTAVFLLQFRNRRPKLAEPLLVFLPERAHFPLVRFSGVQPHQISSGRCPRMRSSISFLRECNLSERSTLYNSGMSRRRYSSQNLESSRLEKSCISISPGKV